MTYATKQNLIDRFGETELARLTDKAAATTIDDTVIERALTDADAKIDGYVSARYAAPLAPVPPLVNQIATAIARYYLWEDGAPEHVRKGFEDALSDLKRIADGTVVLPGAAAAAAGASAPGSAPSFERDCPVFDARGLSGFA
ncbi:hypothetical protein sos41_31320 [Alphaproteobacteria bacterium SO-S41]|nr:hypothetical protein sos41_31320 [Alphaproteobacteria bacterium SO-S41]